MRIIRKAKRILYGTGAVVGLTYGMMWYNGVYKNVRVDEHKIGPFNYLYFNKNGRFNDAPGEWDRITDEMKKTFNKSHAVGLYYDDPSIMNDFSQSRVSMGFVVDDEEKDKIKQFLSSHPDFKHTELPEVQATTASFPYKSFISFKVLADRVYPKMFDTIKRKDIDAPCIMESYIFDKFNKRIDCDAPHGSGAEKYKLM